MKYSTLKTAHKTIIVLLNLFVLFIILEPIFSPPTIRNWRTNMRDDYYYTYDAEKILETISSGNVSASTFILYDAHGVDDKEKVYLLWEQDDYVTLGATFLEFYTSVPTEKWKVIKISASGFYIDYDQKPENAGERNMDFCFVSISFNYPNDPAAKLSARNVFTIYLAPEVNHLWIIETQYYLPRFHKFPEFISKEFDAVHWNYLDTETMDIKLEDLFELAEDISGEEYLEDKEAEYHCNVYMVNEIFRNFDGWHVRTDKGNMWINHNTGEYILDD